MLLEAATEPSGFNDSPRNAQALRKSNKLITFIRFHLQNIVISIAEYLYRVDHDMDVD